MSWLDTATKEQFANAFSVCKEMKWQFDEQGFLEALLFNYTTLFVVVNRLGEKGKQWPEICQDLLYWPGWPVWCGLRIIRRKNQTLDLCLNAARRDIACLEFINDSRMRKKIKKTLIKERLNTD